MSIMVLENNYEYLAKQLKYTGFGDEIAKELRKQMEQGQPNFTLGHLATYGRDQATAQLQFRKSEDSGMYFFNNYTLQVEKGNGAEAMKQTFYITNKEDNVTLKEGYNLLQGRAVHKEFTPKEGEKYNAWMQLDFKGIDENSNYTVKRFHDNYGFDLEASLKSHPIMEMAEGEKRQRLVESLERGNRQSVDYATNSGVHKVYVEAAPQFKSLNFYDENQRRIRPENIGVEAIDKKEEQKNKTSQRQGNDDGAGEKPTKKKNAKKIGSS